MTRSAPDLVSVVLPVRNGQDHIADQLEALAGQTHAGDWELVVVDNGCRDRTLEIVADYRHRMPSVTVADARARPGLNRARNAGAAAARGELLAFCDADDVAAPGWLAGLAGAAPRADLIAGALDFDALNDPPARALCPWDPPTGLNEELGYLAYAPGGNCAVWTDTARRVRWDEGFAFGSSDVEFSWRAQLAGASVAFAPEALMHQRLKPSLAALARQWYAYGKSDPLLYRRFRGRGMPPPQSAGAWTEVVRSARHLVGPRELQADWVRSAARKAGRAVGSARYGALVL